MVPVGEVRVKIVLANAMDQALARRRKLSVHQVRTYEADALVDTGAVALVIPPHVQQNLGCWPRVAEWLSTRTDGKKWSM